MACSLRHINEVWAARELSIILSNVTIFQWKFSLKNYKIYLYAVILPILPENATRGHHCWSLQHISNLIPDLKGTVETETTDVKYNTKNIKMIFSTWTSCMQNWGNCLLISTCPNFVPVKESHQAASFTLITGTDPPSIIKTVWNQKTFYAAFWLQEKDPCSIKKMDDPGPMNNTQCTCNYFL